MKHAASIGFASTLALTASPLIADELTFEFLNLSSQADLGYAIFEDGWNGDNGPDIITSDDIGDLNGNGFAIGYRTMFGNTPVEIRAVASTMTGNVSLVDVDPTSGSPEGIDTGGADVNGSGIFFFGDLYDIDLDVSRTNGLGSLEANAQVTSFGNVQISAGVRSFSVNDMLIADIDAEDTWNVGLEHYVDVTNRMFGAQISASSSWSLGGNLSVDAFASAGMFSNTATVNAGRTGRLDFGGISNSGSATADNSTTAAELGVTVSYALSDSSQINFGYSAFYFNEIANSVASFADTEFAVTTPGIAYTDAVFQGVKIEYVSRF